MITAAALLRRSTGSTLRSHLRSSVCGVIAHSVRMGRRGLEHREVADHCGGIVTRSALPKGVDVEDAHDPAPFDQELCFMEISMDGDGRRLGLISDALHQLVDTSLFAGENQ